MSGSNKNMVSKSRSYSCCLLTLHVALLCNLHSATSLLEAVFSSTTTPATLISATPTLDTCRVLRNPDLDDKISNLFMIKQVTLRASSSKLDCARLCLINKSCVTYMVNQNQRQCRLHGVQISKFNPLLNSAGFVSYDTCRATSAFGALCSKNSSCLLANSACIANICQCSAGWSYSPNVLKCVTECPVYGTVFTSFPHLRINDNNMATVNSLQYSTCASECIAATLFKCRSFELNFNPYVNLCYLQNVTVLHVPESVIYSEQYDITYHQRHCEYID